MAGYAPHRGSRSSTLAERFWPKVLKLEDDGCWLWTGWRDRDGYGEVAMNGRKKRATHVAWLLVSGSQVPRGMVLCHKCDTPACVRPAHLFLGSQSENRWDTLRKGRAAVFGRPMANASRNELAERLIEEYRESLRDSANAVIESKRRRLRTAPPYHHMSRWPEYFSWKEMRARCQRQTNTNYPRYGGRGISVCDRWSRSFQAFLADMGRRPSPMHSIDRIDNDGHYEPSNCRWATRREQRRNQRGFVRFVALDGEILGFSDVANRIAMPASSFWMLWRGKQRPMHQRSRDSYAKSFRLRPEVRKE